MKSLEQVIEEYKGAVFDGRDLYRLAAFVPVSRWAEIGLSPSEDSDLSEFVPTSWTRQNIVEQLGRDVAFGFDKALGHREISASCMFGVVRMWNWVLEEGLEGSTEFALYGLPLFKATALKYGFDNPIGDDTGTEAKYTG